MHHNHIPIQKHKSLQSKSQINQTSSGSMQLLMPLEFCVFDLESTGGNLKTDKIIEIGLVKIKNLKIVETKNFLINPERSIPDFIQKLTHIRPEDVENAPKIHDVLDEILSFIGDAILVAHNTSFDVPFLNMVLEEHGKDKLKNKVLCTNLMTKFLIPQLMSTNLLYMSQLFNFHHKDAHRALADAEASANLLLKYLNIFATKNISKINSLYYPKNKFELDRVHLKKSLFNNSTQDLLNHFLQIANTIPMAYIVVLKSDLGVIKNVFCIKNNFKNFESLIDDINKYEFETLSIYLCGENLEALISSLKYFKKLEDTEKNSYIQYLEKYMTNDHQLPNDKELLPIESYLKNNQIHFLIYNHIIPGQYKIIPLLLVGENHDTVLRIPSHNNKLIQFLNSKANKIKNNKIDTGILPIRLLEIVNSIISFEVNEKNNGMFFIHASSEKKITDLTLGQIEAFTKNLKNNSNFPTYFL